eukprot:TRINITY_DN571_c0_g1_i2.p1 TRINITY_DN571_c0_g1~~TRINITY_DN571_c0_g1_i2.p1  ORF type:complete len:995 (+),score=156.72 TRINITY_DN571_c0_g1_i2:99-3083(+)
MATPQSPSAYVKRFRKLPPDEVDEKKARRDRSHAMVLRLLRQVKLPDVAPDQHHQLELEIDVLRTNRRLSHLNAPPPSPFGSRPITSGLANGSTPPSGLPAAARSINRTPLRWQSHSSHSGWSPSATVPLLSSPPPPHSSPLRAFSSQPHARPRTTSPSAPTAHFNHASPTVVPKNNLRAGDLLWLGDAFSESETGGWRSLVKQHASLTFADQTSREMRLTAIDQRDAIESELAVVGPSREALQNLVYWRQKVLSQTVFVGEPQSTENPPLSDVIWQWIDTQKMSRERLKQLEQLLGLSQPVDGSTMELPQPLEQMSQKIHQSLNTAEEDKSRLGAAIQEGISLLVHELPSDGGLKDAVSRLSGAMREFQQQHTSLNALIEDSKRLHDDEIAHRDEEIERLEAEISQLYKTNKGLAAKNIALQQTVKARTAELYEQARLSVAMESRLNILEGKERAAGVGSEAPGPIDRVMAEAMERSGFFTADRMSRLVGDMDQLIKDLEVEEAAQEQLQGRMGMVVQTLTPTMPTANVGCSATPSEIDKSITLNSKSVTLNVNEANDLLGHFAPLITTNLQTAGVKASLLPLTTVLELIRKLYVAKIRADQECEKAGLPFMKLAEVVYDYFILQHDSIALGQQKLVQFLMSVRQHEHVLTIYTFGQFCGMLVGSPLPAAPNARPPSGDQHGRSVSAASLSSAKGSGAILSKPTLSFTHDDLRCYLWVMQYVYVHDNINHMLFADEAGHWWLAHDSSQELMQRALSCINRKLGETAAENIGNLPVREQPRGLPQAVDTINLEAYLHVALEAFATETQRMCSIILRFTQKITDELRQSTGATAIKVTGPSTGLAVPLSDRSGNQSDEGDELVGVVAVSARSPSPGPDVRRLASRTLFLFCVMEFVFRCVAQSNKLYWSESHQQQRSRWPEPIGRTNPCIHSRCRRRATMATYRAAYPSAIIRGSGLPNHVTSRLCQWHSIDAWSQDVGGTGSTVARDFRRCEHS